MIELNSRVLLLASGLLTLAPDAAIADDFAKVVTKHGEFTENILAAGREISVDGRVDGDVILFGREIAVAGTVIGDVMAAGQSISVVAEIDGDVRIAGENVSIANGVAGEVLAAGRDVALRPTSAVGGKAMLAGESVTVSGRVGGDVRAAGRVVTVTGAIAGDAALAGEEIVIADTARIEGDLIYRSLQEAVIAPGAEILGDTVFIRSDGPKDLVDRFMAGGTAIGLALFAGLFLLGVVQTLVAPGAVALASERMRRPWAVLGIGLAVLVLTPVAMVLSAITVIGIPIAVVLFALFVVALLWGYLVAAGAVGRFGLGLVRRDRSGSFWWRAGALAAGMVVLAIVGFIPVLGGLVVFAALLFGLGTLALFAWRERATAA